MAVWIPYKASPGERQHKKKGSSYQNLCRICGKPVDNGGHVCSGCKVLMKRRKFN